MQPHQLFADRCTSRLHVSAHGQHHIGRGRLQSGVRRSLGVIHAEAPGPSEPRPRCGQWTLAWSAVRRRLRGFCGWWRFYSWQPVYARGAEAELSLRLVLDRE